MFAKHSYSDAYSAVNRRRRDHLASMRPDSSEILMMEIIYAHCNTVNSVVHWGQKRMETYGRATQIDRHQ